MHVPTCQVAAKCFIDVIFHLRTKIVVVIVQVGRSRIAVIARAHHNDASFVPDNGLIVCKVDHKVRVTRYSLH